MVRKFDFFLRMGTLFIFLFRVNCRVTELAVHHLVQNLLCFTFNPSLEKQVERLLSALNCIIHHCTLRYRSQHGNNRSVLLDTTTPHDGPQRPPAQGSE